MMHWHWGFPFGWPFHWFGGMFSMAVLAGIIVLIIWAVNQANRKPGEGTPGKVEALEILKRRYAAGEITREQFEQMKKDIGQ